MSAEYFLERARVIFEAQSHRGGWQQCRTCLRQVVEICYEGSHTVSGPWQALAGLLLAIDGQEALAGLSEPLYKIVQRFG